MSLTDFKSHLKRISIFTLLVLYGGSFYFLGKSQALSKIVKTDKKNASSLDKPVELNLPSEDSQTGSVIGSFVKLCSNTVYGFELAYPKDWFTTYSQNKNQCGFFAPYSFVLPQDTSSFTTPIKTEVLESTDWGETQKFYTNPNDFQNVTSAENIEVNGKPVQKIKALTTGAGQLPRGYAKITYLIFDSKYPIAITFQQLDVKDDVKNFEDKVWEMTESLKYF